MQRYFEAPKRKQNKNKDTRLIWSYHLFKPVCTTESSLFLLRPQTRLKQRNRDSGTLRKVVDSKRRNPLARGTHPPLLGPVPSSDSSSYFLSQKGFTLYGTHR